VTFLAPVFFWWAVAAAAAVIAAHLLVTRQPPSHPLPTVRFAPATPVRATAIARRPEDLWLLLLRVLIVLALGAAWARPVVVPARRSVARVLLWDRSRAVASPKAGQDSVAARWRKGDIVIGFDSSAGVIDPDVGPAASAAEGRLSPALIAAYRAAAGLRSSADSIEIVVISPLSGEEWDAATPAIRALWPGRLTLVRVAGVPESRGSLARPLVEGAPDDPVAVAAHLMSGGTRDSAVRIVRRAPLAADSSWAAAGARVLVRWPAVGAPPGWQSASHVDTAGAVVTAGAALVYPFERRWQPGAAAGRAIARWADGGIAATEQRVGAGCIRDLAVPVPGAGDLVLRRDFARLLRAFTAPCGEAGVAEPAATMDMVLLAGSGALAPTAAIHPSESARTPLVPWLLAMALGLSLLELVLRRRSPALELGAPE